MFPGAHLAAPRPTSRRSSWADPASRRPSPSSTPPPTGSATCCASAGLRTGRPRRVLHGEPPPVPRGRVGLPLRRRSSTPHARPGCTSGELAYILNDCEAQAFITSKYKADQAAEIVADTPGVELRLMLDGTIDGYESLRGRRRRAAGRAARRPRSPAPTCSTRRARPAAQGRRARRSRRRRWTTATSGVARAAASCCSASTTRQSTSPPRRCTTPLRCASASATHGARRHGRGDGALRPRAVPARSSSATASRTARSCRRCSSACSSCPRRCARSYDLSSLRVRDPRRRAVPGAGQAADDRVVRPGDPRVLRRHRGQRLRLLQQRACGWPTRARSGTPIGCTVHIVGEDGEELPHGESGHDLLRGRRHVRVPQRPREDEGLAAPQGLVARSATSATSTTTASSTSPTARRT